MVPQTFPLGEVVAEDGDVGVRGDARGEGPADLALAVVAEFFGVDAFFVGVGVGDGSGGVEDVVPGARAAVAVRLEPVHEAPLLAAAQARVPGAAAGRCR